MIKTSSQIADEVLTKLAVNFLRQAVKGQKSTQRAIQAPAKLREPKSVIAAPKPKAPKTQSPAPPKLPAPEKKTLKPAKVEGVAVPKAVVEPVKAPEPKLTQPGKTLTPPKAPQTATKAQVPPGTKKTTSPSEQQQAGAGYFNTRPGS